MKYRNTRTGRVTDVPDPLPDDDEVTARRKSQMLVLMESSKKWKRLAGEPDPTDETTKDDAPSDDQSDKDDDEGSKAEDILADAGVKHVGGSWYEFPDGEKVQGRKNALKRVTEDAE